MIQRSPRPAPGIRPPTSGIPSTSSDTGRSGRPSRSRPPRRWLLAGLGALGLGLALGAPAGARVQQAGGYAVAETWRSAGGALPADSWRAASGIAVSAEGRVYLADMADGRLVVIEPDASVRLLEPAPGYANGLVGPGHLALDRAAGRLYVADTGADALAVFDLEGRRLATWSDIPGAAGLALTPEGNLVVGLGDTGEVRVYSPDGFRLATWQVVAPDPAGELLRGIDVGLDGRIYVVDGRQQEVHVLSPEGRAVDTLRVNAGEGQELRDIALDEDPRGGRPARYWVATTRGAMWLDPRGGNSNWQLAPTGGAWAIALEPSYGIVVSAPGQRGSGSRVARLPYGQAGFVIPNRMWGGALLLPGTLEGPEVVTVGADGGIYVLDRAPRVQRFAPDGSGVEQFDGASNPTEVEAAPDGTLFVTDGGTLTAYRREAGGWARAWSDPVAPAGRDDSQAVALAYNAAAGEIVALDASQGRLVRWTADGQRGTPTVLRGAVESTVWVDLAADAGGTLYALDRTNRRVHIVAPDLSQRSLGLPAPARQLAVGSGGTLFTLDRDGWVRRYDAGGDPATRTAAFDAARFDLALATAPSDLAVEASGAVLVTDRDAHALTRFAWDPGAAPGEPPEDAGSAGCQSFPDKTASPGRITLGEAVQVQLTVRGGCGTGVSTAPRDIMLILDISGSMSGEKIRILREAALNFVAEVDLASSRVGVVSFTTVPRVEQGLTGNAAALRDTIRQLDAIPSGGTAVDQGLAEAHDHWLPRRRPNAKGVFILFSDGGSALAPARAEADAAKADGAEIYTIGIGSETWRLLMEAVATDPDHYFEAASARFLYGIFERIADRVATATLFRTITVVDRIPANMRYVPDSAEPPAAFDAAANSLTWRLADVPFNGFALRYRLEPRALGEWPTNIEAWGDFVNGFGNPGRLDFPVPRVQVDAPAPTATPTTAPSASPTIPPTATPSPSSTATLPPTQTRTPRPLVPAYIPIALHEKPCVPTDRHADVILVLDTSSSMNGAKISAAKAAARLFVGLLALPQDQAAVVGFNSQATLASGLSGNVDGLRRAIDGLVTEPGTRIDRGLALALAELEGPQRRADNTPAIVLLTDGRQDEEAVLALDLAARARGLGIAIFAIGLGADVDRAFLETLAGSPARSFLAPGPEDLDAIYRQVAFAVPCPAEVYWGRRP